MLCISQRERPSLEFNEHVESVRQESCALPRGGDRHLSGAAVISVAASADSDGRDAERE